MSRFIDELRGARDDVVARHDEQVFADGFDAAANVCIASVDAQAEPLKAQLRSGQLDAEGQRLLSLVQDLKADIEQRLRDHWEKE